MQDGGKIWEGGEDRGQGGGQTDSSLSPPSLPSDINKAFILEYNLGFSRQVS